MGSEIYAFSLLDTIKQGFFIFGSVGIAQSEQHLVEDDTQ